MAYTGYEQVLGNLKSGSTTIASCRSVICRLRKENDEGSMNKIMMYLEAIERFNREKRNLNND